VLLGVLLQDFTTRDRNDGCFGTSAPELLVSLQCLGRKSGNRHRKCEVVIQHR
jgi:hypothetical protein